MTRIKSLWDPLSKGKLLGLEKVQVPYEYQTGDEYWILVEGLNEFIKLGSQPLRRIYYGLVTNGAPFPYNLRLQEKVHSFHNRDDHYGLWLGIRDHADSKNCILFVKRVQPIDLDGDDDDCI